MKRHFLYIGILLTIFLLATGCREVEELEGGLSSTEVVTPEVKDVSYYWATINSESYYGGVHCKIVVSKNADLSDPIDDNSYYYSSSGLELKNLKSGTTYYYQAALVDRMGYEKKGDIKQFTTLPTIRIEAECVRETPTSGMYVYIKIYDFTVPSTDNGYKYSTDIGCNFKRYQPTSPYMDKPSYYDLGWHFNSTQYNTNNDNPWTLTMYIPYSNWSYNDFYFQPYIYNNATQHWDYGDMEHYTYQ